MTRTWQRIGTGAAMFLCAAFWGGDVASIDKLAAARRAEGKPEAESPADYVWTLEYRFRTKPGDERVSAHGIDQKIVLHYVAIVRNIHVRPNGTFTFDDCDFGVMRQETDLLNKQGKSEFHSLSQWQGLLRGTGTWEGGGKSLDEPLNLRLEFAGGSGESVKTSADGKSKTTDRFTASPDGRTQTNVGEILGKLSHLEYPNTFQPSDWTLRPAPAAPAGGGGAGRARRLRILPVSFAAAEDNQCDEKKKDLSGQRARKVPCPGGVDTPINESVKLTGKKKQADVAVTFGDDRSHPQPGSTGTVEAFVSNHGPCETHATLNFRVVAGYLGGSTYAPSQVKVLAHSDGATDVTLNQSEFGDVYSFNYQFTLPSGAGTTVKIEAQDTTPPGQTLPYMISFDAKVLGNLPDPNGGNNFAYRYVTFDPPGKNPQKPTPAKAK